MNGLVSKELITITAEGREAKPPGTYYRKANTRGDTTGPGPWKNREEQGTHKFLNWKKWLSLFLPFSSQWSRGRGADTTQGWGQRRISLKEKTDGSGVGPDWQNPQLRSDCCPGLPCSGFDVTASETGICSEKCIPASQVFGHRVAS